MPCTDSYVVVPSPTFKKFPVYIRLFFILEMLYAEFVSRVAQLNDPDLSDAKFHVDLELFILEVIRSHFSKDIEYYSTIVGRDVAIEMAKQYVGKRAGDKLNIDWRRLAASRGTRILIKSHDGNFQSVWNTDSEDLWFSSNRPDMLRAVKGRIDSIKGDISYEDIMIFEYDDQGRRKLGVPLIEYLAAKQPKRPRRENAAVFVTHVTAMKKQ